eukprot:IDg10326t1
MGAAVLYVGNVSKRTTHQSLKEHFTILGFRPVSCYLCDDYDVRFALVKYPTYHKAIMAKLRLDRTILSHSLIRVSVCDEDEDAWVDEYV